MSRHPSPAGTGVHHTEPGLGGSYIGSPGRPSYGSPGFVTSTPQYGSMGQAVVRAEVMRSSKHDGLCLYFARILEYVSWNFRKFDYTVYVTGF